MINFDYKTIWSPLPLLLQVHHGLLHIEYLFSLSFPFRLEEQVLVPCQAPILEDFHQTLSSHPLLRHDLHNFVLGYESNALIIPHLLQLTLGQSVGAVCAVTPILSVNNN